ncbi:hypothetical protein HAZT_HAZT009805 [Hyalella azteca]|uniref:XPG-I domain-containing protein n=1 Tax=Hyalella azteca TaxID=294128 RepID=A0A6A0H8S1_HYAAZ|nr:hypothetical protein HAZT_HAZT009805 [Hyalella azteca]
MGVKGLWRLIEEAGTPVPLESLENKVLAVDVSIWLHQAVRGFRGIGGETVANAHLLTLFHRICKLLYFGIKPVFVFDGGVPHLKKQTQSLRRVRREAAANRADRIRERLLNNLLKSHAVRHALGRTGPAPSQHKVVPAPKTRQKDMFELPPLPEGQSFGDEALKNKVEEISSDENGEYSEKPRKRGKAFHYKNLHNFDLDSEQFRSLPIQKQHEILVELQDSRKDNSWATINSMPSESSGFATYQMDRLLKRFKFQTTIDSVRSAIQQKKSEELERELFGDLEKHVSQTHKIASEDFAHSIFITKERDTTKDEEPVKPRKVDKGKSLMKKPQKDFLQELMKEGIFKNPNKCSSYCNTDDSSDEEFSDDKYSDSQETRDEALVQVMNYALSDNNGLTQDEILRLIQQSKQEADTMIESDDSKPSTSRNASGVVCNADVNASDSDDTDDFVEVDEPETDISGDLGAGIETAIGKASALEEICPVSHNSESDGDGNNIDALRSSNSSSLYIKIVQHRLDDIIQVEDKSLGKAKVDTRRKNSVSGMSPDSYDDDDFIEVHEPISESRSLSSEETRDPTSTPIKRSGASSVDANDAAPTGNLKNGENLSRKIFTTITKISGVSTTAASSSTSEAVDKTVQNASAPAYVVKSADECNFDTDTSAVNAEVGFAGPNEDDLKKIEQELAKEQKSLVAQAQKGDRIASNLSQQMYTDAQELLQLFGLPYIVAPMEAEAQCAFLDDVKLTNGTITDDSDAFLFGSKHVYKNFFNQSQHVELYKLDNIRTQFGLDREKLITLALLTGSDYTMGIEGVGAVSGMEILSEFPGTGIEILRNFKKWWISVNRGVSVSKPSKLREKLYKVYLPEGFPNDEVYTAYIEPAVDRSREKFEWSVPNTDALREFTADKLGWSRSKTDEILIPVMKRLSVKSSQTRIDTFFNNVRLVKDTKVTSKRLQEAIARSRGDIIQTSPQPKDNLMAKIARDQKASKKPRKRRLASENVSDVSEKATDGMTPRSRIAKKPRVKPINNVPSSTNAARNANNSSVSPSPSISEKQRLSTQEKKEEIFNHLLKKKEEITQRKAAEAEMLRKKQQAAIVLRSKILKGKKD